MSEIFLTHDTAVDKDIEQHIFVDDLLQHSKDRNVVWHFTLDRLEPQSYYVEKVVVKKNSYIDIFMKRMTSNTPIHYRIPHGEFKTHRFFIHFDEIDANKAIIENLVLNRDRYSKMIKEHKIRLKAVKKKNKALKKLKMID